MTGWADAIIKRLAAGPDVVTFRPRGHSMAPLVMDGDTVHVRPLAACAADAPAVGDVVLVKVKRVVYLHLVGKVVGGRYRIENARGYVNGWVPREAIYGIRVANDLEVL